MAARVAKPYRVHVRCIGAKEPISSRKQLYHVFLHILTRLTSTLLPSPLPNGLLPSKDMPWLPKSCALSHHQFLQPLPSVRIERPTDDINIVRLLSIHHRQRTTTAIAKSFRRAGRSRHFRSGFGTVPSERGGGDLNEGQEGTAREALASVAVTVGQVGANG